MGSREIIRKIKSLLFILKIKSFPGSREYWEDRYKSGGTSTNLHPISLYAVQSQNSTGEFPISTPDFHTFTETLQTYGENHPILTFVMVRAITLFTSPEFFKNAVSSLKRMPKRTRQVWNLTR